MINGKQANQRSLKAIRERKQRKNNWFSENEDTVCAIIYFSFLLALIIGGLL